MMRRLDEQIHIRATEETVWSALSDFGGVAKWAPYVRSAVMFGEKPAGVGSYRKMRHFWGFRLEEYVVQWTDRVGYTFEVVVVPYPIENVRETLSLETRNPHVTVASQVTYGMGMGFLGSLLDWVAVRFLIRREMRAGLRGLRRYVESR